MNRVLLVGNPTAQSGKNSERIQAALELFRERGVHAELFSTLPGGATIGALSKHLDDTDESTVVSMGGDGTFREVAAGILGSRRATEIAMGMLPTGTANDQGKSFGLAATPEDLPKNVDVVCAGRETKLDAGVLANVAADGSLEARTLFFDSAGWGLSARVLAVRNRDRQTVAELGPLQEVYRDQLVYAGALLRTFLESQIISDKFSAQITVDGKPHSFTGLTDLIVKATRVYGGAWVFDRESRHDDGQFELIVFRGKREWVSKAIVDLEGNPITEEMLNEIGVEHSKPIRGRSFELRLAPEGEVEVFAQLDGEEHAPWPHVRVDVSARALRLIVP